MKLLFIPHTSNLKCHNDQACKREHNYDSIVHLHCNLHAEKFIDEPSVQ